MLIVFHLGVTRRLDDQFELEISDPNYLLMMATRNQYSEMMMMKLRQKNLQEFRKGKNEDLICAINYIYVDYCFFSSDGLDDHLFRDDEALFDLCVGIQGHKELEQAVS